MFKTAIAAFLTFIGLRVGSEAFKFFQGMFKLVFYALFILVILRAAIPFTVWYFGEIGKSFAPILHKIEGNMGDPATLEQRKWLDQEREKQGYRKCGFCGRYHSKS